MFKRLLFGIMVVALMAAVSPVKLSAAGHKQPVTCQITKQQKDKVRESVPLFAGFFFKIRTAVAFFPFCPDFVRWSLQSGNKIYGDNAGESSEMRHVPNYRKPIPLPPEK